MGRADGPGPGARERRERAAASVARLPQRLRRAQLLPRRQLPTRPQRARGLLLPHGRQLLRHAPGGDGRTRGVARLRVRAGHADGRRARRRVDERRRAARTLDRHGRGRVVFGRQSHSSELRRTLFRHPARPREQGHGRGPERGQRDDRQLLGQQPRGGPGALPRPPASPPGPAHDRLLQRGVPAELLRAHVAAEPRRTHHAVLHRLRGDGVPRTVSRQRGGAEARARAGRHRRLRAPVRTQPPRGGGSGAQRSARTPGRRDPRAGRLRGRLLHLER